MPHPESVTRGWGLFDDHNRGRPGDPRPSKRMKHPKGHRMGRRHHGGGRAPRLAARALRPSSCRSRRSSPSPTRRSRSPPPPSACPPASPTSASAARPPSSYGALILGAVGGPPDRRLAREAPRPEHLSTTTAPEGRLGTASTIDVPSNDARFGRSEATGGEQFTRPGGHLPGEAQQKARKRSNARPKRLPVPCGGIPRSQSE